MEKEKGKAPRLFHQASLWDLQQYLIRANHLGLPISADEVSAIARGGVPAEREADTGREDGLHTGPENCAAEPTAQRAEALVSEHLLTSLDSQTTRVVSSELFRRQHLSRAATRMGDSPPSEAGGTTRTQTSRALEPSHRAMTGQQLPGEVGVDPRPHPRCEVATEAELGTWDAAPTVSLLGAPFKRIQIRPGVAVLDQRISLLQIHLAHLRAFQKQRFGAGTFSAFQGPGFSLNEERAAPEHPL